MVAYNGENRNYSGKNPYGFLNDYFNGIYNMTKKNAGHDCSKCGKIPTKIAIVEVREGREYLGAFDFKPVFRVGGYNPQEESVQAHISLGYLMKFDPNIVNLLRKIRDTPNQVTPEDRMIKTDFMTFDFNNGQAVPISHKNAETLSALAMNGVKYLFDNPESLVQAGSVIADFLGVSSDIRFSATKICIPSTQELMSFLREQWRRK